MSSYMSKVSNKNNAKVAPKPYCKVCFDAGKSEKEYTSHFVRSSPASNGVVVCPTLLAQECRYCHRMGHTVKFCKVLENMQRNDQRNMQGQERPKAKQEPKNLKKLNSFAALGQDSDEEMEKARPTIKEEYPLLKEFTKPVEIVSGVPSYAQMAAKPEAVAMEFKEDPLVVLQLKNSSVAVPSKKPNMPFRWVDHMDSDSDDE